MAIPIFNPSRVALPIRDYSGRTVFGHCFNLGSLRPGQIIELELDGAVAPFEPARLRRISIEPTSTQVVVVRRNGASYELRLMRLSWKQC